MKIFVTGATGFIGRAAITALQGRGHEIIALVRSIDRARDMLGFGPVLLGTDSSREDLRRYLEQCEAVLNLSGRPVVGVRWTASKKEEFWNSRVGLTKILSEEVKKCQSPPSVFVSASAIGCYGDSGDDVLTEKSESGQGYLAELCREWETAALISESANTRVCILRLGIVLGRDGGILSLMTPPFRMGIGGYIGDGQQYISWIHLLDVVRIIVGCIEDSRFKGIFNCTAPNPVRAKEFSSKIGLVTKSKLMVRIPFVLPRMLMGESGSHITYSQYVSPSRLEQNRFGFIFDNLDECLEYEYDYADISIERFDYNRDESVIRSGVQNGQYHLCATSYIHSDPKTVFAFFSSPLNLGLATPSWMRFQIQDMPTEIGVGSHITYNIRIFGIKIRWVTEIVKWEPTNLFVDVQIKGPYTLWHHEHRITQNEDRITFMEDRVVYRMPFGLLGSIVHKWVVMDQLKRIFKFRQMVIMLRFPSDAFYEHSDQG